MSSTQMLYIVITVLILTVIGLAIPLGIYTQKHSQEGLCMCRGGGVKQYVDRSEQMKSYNEGRTEYSDFINPPEYVYEFADPPYSNNME